jgi:hypothetical protein
MEEPNKRRLEDLSSEERRLLVHMTLQGEHIEDCVRNLSGAVPRQSLLELDDILNESYEEFLPKLNTEKLYSSFVEFENLLNLANKNLAVFMSDYLESFITNRFTLLKAEIMSLQSDINRAKEKIIPRLKKLGLNDCVDKLEEAIQGLEIKLAYDSGAEE